MTGNESSGGGAGTVTIEIGQIGAGGASSNNGPYVYPPAIDGGPQFTGGPYIAFPQMQWPEAGGESYECGLGKAIDAAQDAWIRQKGDAKEGLAAEPDETLPVAMARAALRFLRAPTPKMLLAGQTAASTPAAGNVFLWDFTAAHMWRAMIDAASPPTP